MDNLIKIQKQTYKRVDTPSECPSSHLRHCVKHISVANGRFRQTTCAPGMLTSYDRFLHSALRQTTFCACATHYFSSPRVPRSYFLLSATRSYESRFAIYTEHVFPAYTTKIRNASYNLRLRWREWFAAVPQESTIIADLFLIQSHDTMPMIIIIIQFIAIIYYLFDEWTARRPITTSQL
jgi:hypothetical protein